eukprot:m51a1_g3918 hypothetical protein (197) ;mRNA; r:174426-175094
MAPPEIVIALCCVMATTVTVVAGVPSVIDVDTELGPGQSVWYGRTGRFLFKSADLRAVGGEVALCASLDGSCSLSACVKCASGVSKSGSLQVAAADCELRGDVRLCIVALNPFFTTSVIGTLVIDDTSHEVSPLLLLLLVACTVVLGGAVCGVVAYCVASHKRTAQTGTVLFVEPPVSPAPVAGVAVAYRPLDERV